MDAPDAPDAPATLRALKRERARLRDQLRSLGERSMMRPETCYDLWASEYPPRSHNEFMGAEELAMTQLLGSIGGVSGKVCVDLGCGSGRYLRLVVADRPALVVGVDVSANMLARASVEARSVPLVRADLTELPFAAGVADVVVSGLTVGHIADLDRVVSQAARLLVTGGHLVYSDMHPFIALGGTTRGFEREGRVFLAEHNVHLYGDHLRACRAGGLEIVEVVEGHLEGVGPPLPPTVLAVLARRL